MKKLILMVTFLSLFISCLPEKKEKVSQRLRKFYTYYIVEKDTTIGIRPNLKDTLQKYCTASFLKKLQNKELDYDPLMQGQDYDKEWVKTLTIIELPNEKTKYNVCFYYNRTEQHCIIISVAKESGEWKIDDVKDNNN